MYIYFFFIYLYIHIFSNIVLFVGVNIIYIYIHIYIYIYISIYIYMNIYIYNIKSFTTDTLPSEIWKRTILAKPVMKRKKLKCIIPKTTNKRKMIPVRKQLKKKRFWKGNIRKYTTPNMKHLKQDCSEKDKSEKGTIWKRISEKG